jgi:hypothetical protein
LNNSTATGQEFADQQQAVADAEAAAKDLRAQKTAGDEAFAVLNQEDAEGRVALLTQEQKDGTKRLAELKANVAFESSAAEALQETANDASQSAEDRAFAAERYAEAIENVNNLYNDIAITEEQLHQLSDELDHQ